MQTGNKKLEESWPENYVQLRALLLCTLEMQLQKASLMTMYSRCEEMWMLDNTLYKSEWLCSKQHLKKVQWIKHEGTWQTRKKCHMLKSELSFDWKETEIQKHAAIFQKEWTKSYHTAYTLKKNHQRNQGCCCGLTPAST